MRCLRLAELAGLIGVDDGELLTAVILSRPADKDVAGAELQVHTVGTGGLDQHVIAGGSPHPYNKGLEELGQLVGILNLPLHPAPALWQIYWSRNS